MSHKKKLIPFWVPKKYFNKWTKYTLVERSYLYVLVQYEIFLKNYKKDKNILLINYEDLCRKSNKESKKIFNFLKLKKGDTTKKIINSFKFKTYKKNINIEDLELKEKILKLNQKLLNLKSEY